MDIINTFLSVVAGAAYIQRLSRCVFPCRDVFQMIAADRTVNRHPIGKGAGFPGAEPVIAVHKFFQIVAVRPAHRRLIRGDEQRRVLMGIGVPLDQRVVTDAGDHAEPPFTRL